MLQSNVHMVLNYNVAVYEANFLEGINAFPNYYPLYFAATSNYAPHWHGSFEIVKSFANFSVEHTKDTDGGGLYTRIYWSLSQSLRSDRRLSSKTLIDWEKMKTGMQDILAQYPDDWNIQNFAYFACYRADLRTAAALFEQMLSDPIPAVWQNTGLYEACSEAIENLRRFE